MGLAATYVVVVCAVLAASTPTANAFPVALNHRNNMVFFQQSSTVDALTEALVVSNNTKLHCLLQGYTHNNFLRRVL